MGRRRAVELVAWPLLALAAALCVGWACAAVSEGVLGVFRPSEDRDLEGLGVVILSALPYVRRAEARSGRVPTDGLAVLDSWKRQP